MNVGVLAVAIAASCLPLAAFGQPVTKPSPSTPVQVTNDAGNPVPVTGSVTGTVTGTVGLASGASVSIANTATNPVLVQAVREPFQVRLVGGADSSSAKSDDVPVPAGKRLVVEHVSTNVNFCGSGVPSTQIPTAYVQDVDAFIGDTVPCVRAASNALNNNYVCSQNTVMYVPTGHAFSVVVSTLGSARIDFVAFVSGYYLAAP